MKKMALSHIFYDRYKVGKVQLEQINIPRVKQEVLELIKEGSDINEKNE